LTIQSFQQLWLFSKGAIFEFGLDLENKNGNEGRNMVSELLAIIKWSQAVLSGSS
jgi:hypothetical protein